MGQLFVDLIAAGVSRTNDALELLCKAHGDDDGSVWDEHWSPLVRRIIELFTQRGLTRIAAVQSELQGWMEGVRHQASGEAMPPRPDGAMLRWTAAEQNLVKLYLESLPPQDWTLDDHMLMVDFVVQRHLPADQLISEARWMAQRAALMGKVQANLAKPAAFEDVDRFLESLPPGDMRDVQGLTRAQRQVMAFAANRAAENVTALADSARHQLRGIVARQVERRELGDQRGRTMEGELLDEFATLNRDWRRIAVTEATEAQGQGYIAAQKPGTKVKRFEHYKGACKFCESINGKVFTVVDSSDPDKDGATMVWIGKTNVGRSASPRKRMGDILVEREPEERWHVAAGAQHPHCRGAWLPVVEDQPGDDPDFSAWMREVMEKRNA